MCKTYNNKSEDHQNVDCYIINTCISTIVIGPQSYHKINNILSNLQINRKEMLNRN